MSAPFKIDGPTCISFSGGRTSAYMLWRVLQSNGGLPEAARVIFCNTGKEEEATLRFVQECAVRWAAPITWLEYTGEAGVREVDFASASRKGEPFEAIIAQRGGVLPNRVARFCSSEMKTRTMHRYLRSQGWTEWDTFIGIRADEPRRVAKFRANPHPEGKHEEVHMPLAAMGIGAAAVGTFWRSNGFDLELPNINGKTMHGNCDLCYLKPAHQVFSLIAEKPERAVWWAEKERKAETIVPRREWDEPVMVEVIKPREQYEAEVKEHERWLETPEAQDLDELDMPDEPSRFMWVPKLDEADSPVVLHHSLPGTAARFRDDRASYAEMADFAASQRDAFGHADEEAISCFCGD